MRFFKMTIVDLTHTRVETTTIWQFHTDIHHRIWHKQRQTIEPPTNNKKT
jgi:hypothetical protein